VTRFAVLVKQIPAGEEIELGTSGRLIRDDAPLEMSAYCRRAVSKAVELASQARGSSVVVFTLGPTAAQDVLREALAWGLDRGVEIRGVHVTDPALAGSDTIATAQALAAAIDREGPFDVVLTGRNSLDADTGQVPPQLAQLLDLPFVAGVKVLAFHAQSLAVGCEQDDGWIDAQVRLPAVISCAERLCDPAKVPPASRATVPPEAISTLTAAELGPGPWGGRCQLDGGRRDPAAFRSTVPSAQPGCPAGGSSARCCAGAVRSRRPRRRPGVRSTLTRGHRRAGAGRRGYRRT